MFEYSAARLRNAPQDALEAVVPVCAEPVELEPLGGGRLLVLDSDRYRLARASLGRVLVSDYDAGGLV